MNVGLALSVSLVFSCLFLDNFLLFQLAPILDTVAKLCHVQKHMVAYLYFVKPLVTLPTSILTGKLVNLIGPIPTCALGSTCYFIACWFYAFADQLYLWFIARIFQAVGSALTVGAGMYLIYMSAQPRDRGKLMGIAYTGNGVGVFLGPLVGSYLFHDKRVGPFYLHFALSFIAVFQVVLGIIIARRSNPTTERKPHVRNAFSVWLQLLRNKQMICVILAASSACTVLGIVEPLLPGIIKERTGYDNKKIDLLWAFGNFFYPITIPAAGWISDHVQRHYVVLFGLAGFAVLLPWWELMQRSVYSIVAYLGLVFALDATVDAPIHPLIAHVADDLELGENSAVAYTLGDVAQNFGHLFGPAIAIILEKRLEASEDMNDPIMIRTLFVVSAWFILAFLVVLWGFWRNQKIEENKNSYV
jgi:MFS transporter, DHA1 family, solute carrier family 18 (vesicular amine transporter), member 1/2